MADTKIWARSTQSIGISLKSGSTADEVSDAISALVSRAKAEDPDVTSVVRVRSEDPWVLVTYTWDALIHTGDTGTMPAVDDGPQPASAGPASGWRGTGARGRN